ncbi:MAG: DEAD/DEAH box helicase family protein [Actinobacteria bacterium]|nr:DEAD/DEAH box helicase family protein [Actinomycetota bacterium]
MEIQTDNIKNYAGSVIYGRGLRYYKQGRVRLDEIELERFTAIVSGTYDYTVRAERVGEKIYTSCTCPYWTTCKHVVAALLTAKDYYDENGRDLKYKKTHPEWKKFFDRVIENRDTPKALLSQQSQIWKIIYVISLSSESWRIWPQKAYIKKNGELGRRANVGEFDPDNTSLIHSQNDPYIISFLNKQQEINNSFYNYNYYRSYRYNNYGSFHFKYGSKLGPLFNFLSESTIFLINSSDELEPLEMSADQCRIEFQFDETKETFCLTPKVIFQDSVEHLDGNYSILTENPVWLLRGNMLIKVENIDNAELLLPLTANDVKLSIPKNEFPQFLEKTYPQLVIKTPMPLPDSIHVQTSSEISGKRLYLVEGFNQLEVFLRFVYGDREVDFNDPQEELYDAGGKEILKIKRDREAEKREYERLLDSGLKAIPKGGLRVIDSKALEWLFANLPKVVKDGFEVYGQEKLKKYKVRTGSPNVSVAVSTNIDWFDLNLKVDIEGIELSLKELKKAIRKKYRYVKLADQSMAKLSESWFKKFQHLFNFSEVEANEIKVSKFHVTLIDLLFDEVADKHTDKEYRDNLAKLKSFEGIKKHRLPKGIKGTLRPYQKSGYDWLLFLKDFSFGGCLADDMGLGKTVQTLALLLHEKEKGNKIPSLIVCPTSVVFNWDLEVKKFTPKLRPLIHTGLKRQKDVSEFEKYDIILTTYGIMRRDFAFLKDYKFHYIILDESQKIKNPLSQTAKAARVLSSAHRLVLTGTPVENNTIELWSQFSFLNPGLLGSLNYYRKSFTLPIEKRGDEGAATFLKQIIFPFILRRTKEHVAKELPPKNEQIFYCTMNPAQKKLYERWRDIYRAKILSKIDDAGMDKARMNVLEGLVRLRQIACHPYLIDHEATEESGKFELLKEFVDEILAENHKILLFSQFVKMLKLIRNYFDTQGIEYEYLDGHTTNRMQHVERFQNDEKIRIFLISLKAGGTGLNLTAADYVIHYDPWWNPAVEMQATDRAHRIGQDKKVFVYRLITKDSVEEKMLQLQSRKKKLVTDLISTDSSFFKSLDRDDIEVLFS